MNGITGQIDTLSGLLDVASLRHRVIAQNVANVNTPGYRNLAVSFEGELARHLARGDGQSQAARPRVGEGGGGRERVDGNNVDIDAELGHLQKNSMLYQTLTQVLAVKLGALRSAISGH